MKERLRFCGPVLVVLALALLALHVQPQTPQVQQREPWDIGQRPPNWSAPSTLEVENRCKLPHQFNVSKENLAFLSFMDATQFTVPPGPQNSHKLPVRFDTTGMEAREYNGIVLVKCLDCFREKTCTQDRDILPVHLIVVQPMTPPTTPTTPQPAPITTPTTMPHPPPTAAKPPCQQVVKDCERLKAIVDQKRKEWEAALAAEDAAHTDLLAKEKAVSDAETAEHKASEAFDAAPNAAVREQLRAVRGAVILKVLAAHTDWEEAFKKWSAARQKSIDASGALLDAEAAYRHCLEAKEDVCDGGGPRTDIGGATPAGPGVIPTGDKPTTANAPCSASDCDAARRRVEDARAAALKALEAYINALSDAWVKWTAAIAASQEVDSAARDAINTRDPQAAQAALLRLQVAAHPVSQLYLYKLIQEAFAADLAVQVAAVAKKVADEELRKAMPAYDACRERLAKTCDIRLPGVGLQWKIPQPGQPGKPVVTEIPKPTETPSGGKPATGTTGTPVTPTSGHPTTATRPPCPTADDCERLRKIAEQKEAAAKTAQEKAAEAESEATEAEAAAGRADAAAKQAGTAVAAGKKGAKAETLQDAANKAAQDAAAARAMATGARENAKQAQREAEAAEAAAKAARAAADECEKKRHDCEHPTTTAQDTGGATSGGKPTVTPTSGGGGHPTTMSKDDCPPIEDCDELKRRWEEAKTAAAIAQAEADHVAANQAWNASDAAYHAQVAASDQAFADGETKRAKEWRKLAGDRAALAERERQFAQQYPPGDAHRQFWDNEAALDDKEVEARNKEANELEEMERRYDGKAAQETAQSGQAQSAAQQAQAKADAAKAAADAARKAYEDCLERVRRAKEECEKKKAAGGTTTSGGGTGGTTTTGGGTPATGGGSGGKPTTPGTGGQPDGKMPTKPPDTTGEVCTPKRYAIPGGGLVIGDPRSLSPRSLEVRTSNETITSTGGVTFHCKEPGTFRFIYDDGNGQRHTVTVQCNARSQ